MTMTEKLDILMARRNMTRGKLASATGIPYNTIVGFYTKGYNNIKLSNLKKVADFFDISLDILCDDEKGIDEADELCREALVTKKYSALSDKGRNIVDSLLDGLSDLESVDSVPEKKIHKIEYIKEYLTPAAAGYASPAEGDDYILTPRTSDVPAKADFAVRISGDSMEPVIKDGQRVYVSRTNGLEPGDVGIFFVDGDMKCKQYCEDSQGNIYLFSVNRNRKDADSYISADSGVTVFCFGKVLLEKRISLPLD